MNTVYIVLYLTIVIDIFHHGLGDKQQGTLVRHQTPADSVALKNAAQRLLGLRNIPTGEGVPTEFDVKMAPKYMLDLYEKYKDGRIRSGKRVANTVRSIQAEVGVINTQTMFVFNLSSILLSEKILKAEVHLYKRRMKLSRMSDIYMDMNELGPTFLRKLDHRRVPQVARGWQAADVTAAVEACLGYSDGLPRMMALGFSAPKGDDDKLERMTTRTLIRRISRPYLVVYSNDTQNISVDHIHPYIQPTDLTSTYVDPRTGLVERFSVFGEDRSDDSKLPKDDEVVVDNIDMEDTIKQDRRHWFGDKKFFEYFSKSDVVTSRSEYKTSTKKANKLHHRSNKHHNEIYMSRRHRRSIVDNNIPEDPDDDVIPDAGYTFPETHPGILQSRTQYRLKLPRKQGKLIPYPENYKKQRRKQHRQRRKRRKNRRNKDGHEGFGDLRYEWDLEGGMSLTQVQQLCNKRTLAVDFADIGWSEWIISPRSFEANYCAGSCPFPLSQKLKPSNHATIQSLVHAIGLNSEVPGPCCVPDKMSAVTLLYFDESKNVVLKNYPEMSVDSCSCR